VVDADHVAQGAEQRRVFSIPLAHRQDAGPVAALRVSASRAFSRTLAYVVDLKTAPEREGLPTGHALAIRGDCLWEPENHATECRMTAAEELSYNGTPMKPMKLAALVAAALNAGCPGNPNKPVVCSPPNLNQLSVCGACSASATGQATWVRDDGTTLVLRFTIDGSPVGTAEYQYSVQYPEDGGGVTESGTYDLTYPADGPVLDLYPRQPPGNQQRLHVTAAQDAQCNLSTLTLGCVPFSDGGTSPCGLMAPLSGLYTAVH
jgi:hypothetical protein